MKANFTRNLRSFVLTTFASVAAFTISLQEAAAQKWSGVNGNEWLENKYDQPWVRIGIKAKGIHRIAVSSLPAEFQSADKSKISLYHRGQEVAIIKADNNEILFYGVPNSGESDALLYRLQTSRRNPYFSIYSYEGAYFLTVNPSADGLRAETIAPAVSGDAVELTSHLKKEVKMFSNEFSHSTRIVYRPPYLNSYFEDGKQGTGSTLYAQYGTEMFTTNVKPRFYSNTYVAEPFSFRTRGYSGSGDRKITVQLKGRNSIAKARIFVGKDQTESNLREVGNLNTTDCNDYSFSFNLQNNDVSANGDGFLGFRSEQLGTAGSGYSVSYYTVEYNQNVDAFGDPVTEFVFPATNSGVQSKIVVANAPAGALYYDVTNSDIPKIISPNSGSLYVDRDGNALTVLASNLINSVASDKIQTATFSEIDPSDFDYLIISAGSLVSSANSYANYRRAESPGKKYKPLVKSITDIYNQFNYGEQSAVAIRRFVDYMISDGDKKKFLLLIGKSTTYYEYSTADIPDEVPSVGYPGSDMLLTDGLGGGPDDVPAIPVGRISAIDNQQVLDYLAKLKKYEAQTNIAWRKNVIHMNGGKSPLEVKSFKDYLSGIASKVTDAPFSGTIIQKVKTDESTATQQTTLSAEVNGVGVGFISYFGHGNIDNTDYNAGYATDASRGYNNTENYPVLFYNGCGVNNVFGGRFGAAGTSTARPMSLDWLLAPNKGAIAVFGNTWDAYPENSNEYLDVLYPYIFSVDPSTPHKDRLTLGQILQRVAQDMKTAKGYSYSVAANSRVQAGDYNIDRANVHQVLLQGDPALLVVLASTPLPVTLVSFDAKPVNDEVHLSWTTASETNNGHFLIQRSYNAKNFETIGLVEGKGTTVTTSNYTFVDSKPLAGTSYYRLKQVDMPKTVDGKEVAGVATDSRIVSVIRDDQNLFVVSPNPTADFVDVKLDLPVSIEKWSVLDVQGKVRRKGTANSKVSLQNLATGTYVVEIITVNGDIYRKQVVKK